MAHRSLLLLAFVSLFLARLQAQYDRPYRSYGTQKVHKRLLSEDLGFAASLSAIEAHIQFYGANGDGRKDTVPVVFHILYVPGQPCPDEAQVLSQIEALNRDFENYDAALEPFVFDKVQLMADAAVDAGTFFCLPSVGVNGEPVSPILFVATDTAQWSDNDAIKSSASGGADAWDTQKYLNIWVGTLGNYVSGYAQLPGGPAATDGIVIDPRLFGTSGTAVFPYDEGKTLTHLAGSYLGLYELWNEDVSCSDDKVDDTPIHNAPNYGLGTNYHHVSLCDSTLAVEMVINFMDNTDDAALSMFTQGQKNRMKAVLSDEGPRASLTSWNVSCGPFGLRPAESRAESDKTLRPSFKLFPNPASNTLNLEIEAKQPGIVTFTACNVLGKTVWLSKYPLIEGTQLFRADCGSWGAGIYFVKAVFENGVAITQKVCLERR